MEITSFGGTDVNGSTGIVLRFGYGQWAPYTATTQLRDRVNRSPQFLSVSYPAKQQPFKVHIGPQYSGTTDQFMSAVEELFSVRATYQALIADRIAGDDSTEMQVQARVNSFGRVEDNQWAGTFEILDAVWQSTTQQTDDSSPTTNGGQLAVLPSIALSGGSTAVRNRGTVTDRTGHGVKNYPVRFGYGTGYDPTNILVYINAISSPFWYDATSGALWVRVNCRPQGSTFVDVYRSDDISNSVTAQALDLGGIDPVASTNTTIVWNDLQVEQHPDAAALSWLPGLIPNWTSPVGDSGSSVSLSFGIETQEANELSFRWAINSAGRNNDVNVMVLASPVPFSGTLSGLSRFSQQSETTEGGMLIGVWYKQRGDRTERVAWSYNAGSGSVVTEGLLDHTATDDISIPGAVWLAVGFKISALNGDLSGTQTGIVTFEGVGGDDTFSGTLDSTQTPSVSLSDDIDALYLNGTLTNSTTGDTISFVGLLYDDVTLTLDPNDLDISPESGPWYADALEFNNAPEWFTLAVGSNSWTITGGATVVFIWYEKEAF